MAASSTLLQQHSSGKSAIGRSGVLTLAGFGIKVRMQSGHLEIEDGIGPDRRRLRLPRVGHGLKRLVVISSNGFVTLEALRWLADQEAAFAMLDRDGKVLVTTGPVRSSDARLRRAQALAGRSEVGLQIARELISRKLAGQERVMRDVFRDATVAAEIAHCRTQLLQADRFDAVRSLESRGAAAYWAAWRDLPVTFPAKDLPRVPEHWRAFGTRKSLLTGSPRLAINPPNAMLNYLYAVLESESRLAAAALGLDPGLGLLHMDTPARDSLACDLMEAVRPQVDRYVLTWILSQPLRREWFLEQRDGNCRLMASFASRLSETANGWARAVAPLAEWVAQHLWSTTRKRTTRNYFSTTRLTQDNRREAQGGLSQTATPVAPVGPRVEKICHSCGATLRRGQHHCVTCVAPLRAERMIVVAQQGRRHAYSSAAQASRSSTQQQHRSAIRDWKPSDNPAWLTEETYRTKIQPHLANVKNSDIARAVGISFQYAISIRRGKRQPHPRHWQALATLASVSPNTVVLVDTSGNRQTNV